MGRVGRRVAFVMVVLGVGCLLAAVGVLYSTDFLRMQPGEYALTVTPVDSSPSTSAVIDGSALTEDPLDAVETALREGSLVHDVERDGPVIDELRRSEYVRLDGRLYGNQLDAAGPDTGTVASFVISFGVLGAVFVKWGGRRLRPV